MFQKKGLLLIVVLSLCFIISSYLLCRLPAFKYYNVLC